MENFTQNQLTQYSRWAVRAIQHSVPLDEIIIETRRYHGDDFASAVEENVQQLLQ